MIQPFIAYQATGRITRWGYVQDTDLPRQSAPGLTFLAADAAARPATHYVTGGAVTPRPACPVSASAAGLTITLTGVPLGASMSLSGDVTYSATNTDATGHVALVLADPGHYSVAVDCFPAQNFTQDFAL
jgi:hypothetical protein